METLLVTIKRVDTHLTDVYRKFRSRLRTELARLLETRPSSRSVASIVLVDPPYRRWAFGLTYLSVIVRPVCSLCPSTTSSIVSDGCRV